MDEVVTVSCQYVNTPEINLMRREKRINYCTSKFRSVNVTNKLTTPLIMGSKYCRERQRRGEN